jgi:RNA polymerase sigma-70 factor (ECF subfamily)
VLPGDASPELLHRDLVSIVGKDADLVIRVAVDGFSQSEVATELGLSEAATRKRYQRATRRLRDVLQEFR